MHSPPTTTNQLYISSTTTIGIGASPGIGYETMAYNSGTLGFAST